MTCSTTSIPIIKPVAASILIAIAALLLLFPATGMGQGIPSMHDPYLEFGFDPSAVMTLPLGTLTSIRGSIPCSPTFTASTNVNLGMLLRMSYVFNGGPGEGFRLRALSATAGYDNLSSLFLSKPAETFEAYDPVNDRYTPVQTEHTAAFTMEYLRATVEADFSPGADIIIRGGPSISFPIAGSSRESEAVLAPSNATFLDRTQERTLDEGTGDLSDLGMRLGIGLSLAYRLPLGTRLFFEPTIGVDLGLTNVQPDWSPLLVRGGISVGYAFIPEEEPVAPPPVVVHADTVRPNRTPFSANISIEPAPPRLPIEFRRQIVARYVPLLPTIFFERNSPELPERYARLAPPGSAPRGGEPGAFDEDLLPGDAEQAHHQALNIFGSRLRANPRVRATITGTTSSDEENRQGLAQTRAETVADYLARVWGIERNRMTLRSRLDPAVPSNSDYPEGREENRRVELEFSDDAIYGPVQLRTVEPITEPEEIPFRITANSPHGIDRWQVLLVGPDGAALEEQSGRGTPPGMMRWALNNEDREKVLSAGQVGYTLTVYDSAGSSVATPTRPLPVQLDTTISVTTSANRPDNSADFLLVTFDFDRAELTRRGRRELETILARIGPDSRVSIVGYTDATGEQSRNITLAAERASRVASLMPRGTRVEHRGAAPDEAPYSSSTPEGRFLSRTVRVVVVNPR